MTFVRAALAAVLSLVLAAAALAWVPKQSIKPERVSGTEFRLVGKNTLGDLHVTINDKNLFQGFRGDGKNGEQTVWFEIKSAGLGAGWKITGKIGEMNIDLRAKETGAFSGKWDVWGKVGEREVKELVTGDWDIDPAIWAALTAFDF